MKALLVRVGIDSTNDGGSWNAPVDSATNHFVYVAIPEHNARPGFEKPYRLVADTLTRFSSALPEHLRRKNMHLDPDFDHLTYGDQGARAKQIQTKLGPGDLLVFYAGLRDVRPPCQLVYAIIGLYVIDEKVRATDIPASRLHENAHTRIRKPHPGHIVVRARPKVSGRLERCIPIGDYRDRAYCGFR